MREELISLIDKCNKAVDGRLIRVPIEGYVDKILVDGTISTFTIQGKIVGLGAFYANNIAEKKTFLTMICVDPEHEGKKIAKFLLQNWVGYALANDFGKLGIEIGNYNERTMYLFTRLGFKKVKELEKSFIFECDAENINKDYLGIT